MRELLMEYNLISWIWNLKSMRETLKFQILWGTLADLVMFGADRTMIETFLHTTSLAVFEGPTVTNGPSGPKKCEKRVIKPTIKMMCNDEANLAQASHGDQTSPTTCGSRFTVEKKLRFTW